MMKATVSNSQKKIYKIRAILQKAISGLKLPKLKKIMVQRHVFTTITR